MDNGGLRGTCFFCDQSWGKCSCIALAEDQAFDWEAFRITEPGVSTCGRFFVDPMKYYGLSSERCEELRRLVRRCDGCARDACPCPSHDVIQLTCDECGTTWAICRKSGLGLEVRTFHVLADGMLEGVFEQRSDAEGYANELRGIGGRDVTIAISSKGKAS